MIVVECRMMRCTLSGGVAAYPASGTTMDDLFHAVDVLMYKAKTPAGTSCGCTNPPPRFSTHQ